MLTGEIKWSSLITRDEPFNVLYRNAVFASIEFRWPENLDRIPETEVSNFNLVKKVIDTRADVKRLSLALVLRRRIVGSPSFEEVRFPMRWKSKRIDSPKGRRFIFFPRPEQVYVLFPVTKDNWTQVPKALRPTVPYVLPTNVNVPFKSTRIPTLVVQSARQRFPKEVKPWYKASRHSASPNDRDNVSVVNKYPFEFHRNNPDLSQLQEVGIETRYLRRVRTITPNYRSLKVAERPVNPYALDTVMLEPGMAWQQITAIMEPQPQTETFVVAPTVSFVSVPSPALTHGGNSYNKTVKKISDLASGEVSNLAETLVTWRQLDGLIGKNTMKLVDAARNVRKFRFARASEILFHGHSEVIFRRKPSRSRSFAENWLEFQYGWKPVLMDIRGVLDAFALRAAATERIVTVRASSVDVSTTNHPIMSPLYGSYATVTPQEISRFAMMRTERTRIGLRFKLDDADRRFMTQLGFTNPVSLLWELVPFSFVLDWMLPVGDYLEGLTSFSGLTFVDGFLTRSTRENTFCSFSSNLTQGSGPQTIRVQCKGGFKRERFMMRREKLLSFPQRQAPTFKNPFTFTHTANALALLRVIFAK